MSSCTNEQVCNPYLSLNLPDMARQRLPQCRRGLRSYKPLGHLAALEDV